MGGGLSSMTPPVTSNAMPYVGIGEWIRSGISAFHRALDAREVVNATERVLAPGLSL